ncbi:MAG: site-2 protease family protein [Anaerolineaceae bacterium]|nr:site-2 protease family protein [Anaerolineaceae bacterium]
MDINLNLATLEPLVRQVFSIEDITLGDLQKDRFLVRYRGRLLGADSETSYDQLSALLKPYDLTPLFRWDEGRHMILLLPGQPTPKPSNPWVNLVLLIVTFFSVMVTGALFSLQGELSEDFGQAALQLFREGWPFAVSILAVLGAHEFGHYLVGRAHGVHVTLPYFIPMPILNPFGTMGAFISMKELPKNRKVLLDIGLAGPFAGVLVAIPVLILGLMLSTLEPIPMEIPEGMYLQMEGNSLLYLLLKFLVFGQLLPQPVSYEGLSPLLYWVMYFFTGRPFPFGGLDVTIHPVALAGWGGLLVTALNLLPAGQLDGGHVIYVLLGRDRARRLLPFVLITTFLLGFVSPSWWLWTLLISVFGRVNAEPLDEITPLNPARKVMAVAAMVLFVLVFTPVPLLIKM